MNITFHEFLRTQINRDDPIGDFAIDTMDLKNSFNLPNDKEVWDSFLVQNHACSEAKRAFTQAWREYKQLLDS